MTIWFLRGVLHDHGQRVEVRAVHVVAAAGGIHVAVGFKGELLEQPDQRRRAGRVRAARRIGCHGATSLFRSPVDARLPVLMHALRSLLQRRAADPEPEVRA